ncbi:MAG TPA: helicase-exonuclease AddAB subunit AddA, partial [Clostridiaceae bacterium]|nr:helicase-exonuclease AddAB subunit AddA [Clostridiaceae bacterium]
MSLYLGEINYDEGEFLNPGAVFPDDEAGKDEYGHSIELHIIDMKKDESKAEDEREDQVSREGGTAEDIEDLDSIQVEARLIGERILSLMGLRSSQPFRVYDKDLGDYRNLEYRDIVILLRTVKGWSEVFMEELEGMGIPTFADTGTGFFKRSEVQIVMSLLQIIDNPMQDIPLIAVLKSAI